MSLRPCLTCQKLSKGSYCPEHTKSRENARSAARAVTEPWRAIYQTAEWQRQRRLALQRDRACQALRNGEPCLSTHKLTVHHRVPLRLGGSPYDLDNLITLCPVCHSAIERQWQLHNEERNA